MRIDITDFGLEDRAQVARFIHGREELLKGDEFFVPERGSARKERLRERELLDPAAGTGAGTSQFARLFLAAIDRRIAARVAVFSSNDASKKQARFCLFECQNDRRVFDALFLRALDWLKDRGIRQLIGPLSPTPEGRVGCSINEPAQPPSLLLPYHPRYYWSLFEGYGLQTHNECYCYTSTRKSLQPHPMFNRLLHRGGKASERDPDLSIRNLDLKEIDAEIERALGIQKAAAEQGWRFGALVPSHLREALSDYRAYVDPDLFVFVLRESRPIGCMIAIPDANRALLEQRKYRAPFRTIAQRLEREKIRRLRVVSLGILSPDSNLDVLGYLTREILTRALDKRYTDVEIGWIPQESQDLIEGIRRLLPVDRVTTYRTYRIDV